MPRFLFDSQLFELSKFKNEAELERVVVNFSNYIFGENTVYFDIKREVRQKKARLRGRPDGYLISLIGGSPKLFIIENEISEHDELEIGQQLLKYQATFKEGQYRTKEILQQEIKKNNSVQIAIQTVQKATSFPNVSELLDEAIFRNEPGYIVIIDEASDRLRQVLKVLESPPEVIEVKKFSSKTHSTYYFSDFQFALVKESTSRRVSELTEVDTIVCPARPSGFKEVFLAQNRWYSIRMSAAMIPQIKYVAMYETKPYSGIRWIGYVQDIKPYQDTDKFEIVLSEKEKLDTPIKTNPADIKKGLVPRGPKYTKMSLLKTAKNLEDIF